VHPALDGKYRPPMANLACTESAPATARQYKETWSKDGFAGSVRATDRTRSVV